MYYGISLVPMITWIFSGLILIVFTLRLLGIKKIPRLSKFSLFFALGIFLQVIFLPGKNTLSTLAFEHQTFTFTQFLNFNIYTFSAYLRTALLSNLFFLFAGYNFSHTGIKKNRWAGKLLMVDSIVGIVSVLLANSVPIIELVYIPMGIYEIIPWFDLFWYISVFSALVVVILHPLILGISYFIIGIAILHGRSLLEIYEKGVKIEISLDAVNVKEPK
jgi:hypothetical protein